MNSEITIFVIADVCGLELSSKFVKKLKSSEWKITMYSYFWSHSKLYFQSCPVWDQQSSRTDERTRFARLFENASSSVFIDQWWLNFPQLLAGKSPVAYTIVILVVHGMNRLPRFSSLLNTRNSEFGDTISNSQGGDLLSFTTLSASTIFFR